MESIGAPMKNIRCTCVLGTRYDICRSRVSGVRVVFWVLEIMKPLIQLSSETLSFWETEGGRD
jgi:hypothetical protein